MEDNKVAMPEQNPPKMPAGFLGKVFHPGWKATFAFSLLTTVSIYFVFIRRAGFADKYIISIIVFVLIYTFITKLMLNARS